MAKTKTRGDAIKEIVGCAGTQFDPGVVDAFLKWVEHFTPQRRVSVF